ncbi:MAG: thermopsin, partial [Thermoplasmata archaeon]|nr:thermopsin [Thermoplasmata archaeon]
RAPVDPGTLGTAHAAVAAVGAHASATPATPSGARPSSPAPSRAATSASLGLAPHPATKVDPLLGYSHEPAPMGIADFGVTGAQSTATAYEYSTSSFEGRATVSSMDVSITGSSSKVTAFELNEILVLRLNGVNFTYWIQNGLHVDAGSREYTIGGAYVWNFSAPGAHLSAGELRGNASSVLVSDTYYFIPGCGGFAGQCTTLSWPATLMGRVLTSTSGGVPYVEYQYDLGSGWVTYDNVSFLHMAGATDTGFVVDGYQPTPIGSTLFYDAEWDWVGAGGGSSSVVKTSDLDLSLYYWNGENFQAVPSAWNFGGDTGETTSNVTEVRGQQGSDLAPSAHVTNGPGTLGVLYNTTNIGFLNLTLPTRSPQLVDLSGTFVPVRNGTVNLTIDAGTYGLALQNYSNATRDVLIAPGATSFVNLSGAGRVAVRESGLPDGTPWGISVDGQAQSAAASTLVFNLPNGTFPITYSAVPGYVRNSSDPVVLTAPTLSLIGIGWHPFTFTIPITEVGLPDASSWWVSAGGSVLRGSTSTLDVAAPNGSTPFEVGASYAFVAAPSSGWINISHGSYAPVEVQFTYRYGYIAGTVSPLATEITIDGAAETVTDGRFNASVLPGEFTLVANATGYATQTLQVNATAGNVTAESIVLVALPTHGVISTPPTNPSVLSTEVLIASVAVIGIGVVAGAVVALRRRSMQE